MDDEPQQEPLEAAKEEEKWNEIVSQYADEDSMNLMWSFSAFETGVKNLTNEFQNGDEGIKPDDLKGLWNMFLNSRKQVVEAYGYKDKDPVRFQKRIKDIGMKRVDGLFHAISFYGSETPLGNRLWGHLKWTESALEDEYDIQTHAPYEGQKPNLLCENIISGSGDEISRVIQPAFIEKSTGKLIREATVETK